MRIIKAKTLTHKETGKKINLMQMIIGAVFVTVAQKEGDEEYYLNMGDIENHRIVSKEKLDQNIDYLIKQEEEFSRSRK